MASTKPAGVSNFLNLPVIVKRQCVYQYQSQFLGFLQSWQPRLTRPFFIIMFTKERVPSIWDFQNVKIKVQYVC